jgi:hypothetical protein
MLPIRKIAGALTILESFWAAYIQIQDVAVSCPAGGCPWPSPYLLHTWESLLLVVVLLAVGVLGFWGASFAYPVGAALSGVMLLIMGYSAWTDGAYLYLQGESQLAAVGAGFAAAALVLNVLGAVRKGGLSEQANPMNLPVFG